MTKGAGARKTILESYVHHVLSTLVGDYIYITVYHMIKIPRRNQGGHDKFINTSKLHQKKTICNPPGVSSRDLSGMVLHMTVSMVVGGAKKVTTGIMQPRSISTPFLGYLHLPFLTYFGTLTTFF